jgi:pimeloyl-ACP methyl ester carboxylesterase
MTKKAREEAMNDAQALEAPGALLLALEARVLWEFAAAVVTFPWLRNGPKGDGHSVMVFPGLAAPDLSTMPLRTFLSQREYDTHGWSQRFNLGPRKGVLEASLERVRKLRQRSGRKVSLVGWSLGGIYAREIAKLIPDDVRCVVTLGTPFTGTPRATNAWRIYELASGQPLPDPGLLERVSEGPPVPTTSIYSRSDGIVSWQCSVQKRGRQAENIEVTASHIGLGLHPASWYAVADRLAQPEGKWRPFHREGWRDLFFSDPDR